MWLVLCPAHDLSAHWACHGLRARGLAPVELVTAEALARAVRWEHRVGAEGASIDVRLADGRTLAGGRVRGVLNRLLGAPTAHFAGSPDREYATMELTAFFLSWLHALPGPVLNPPTPQGLSGRFRHASEWAVLAAQAGLPALPYRQSSRDPEPAVFAERPMAPAGTPLATVLVVAGRVSTLEAPWVPPAIEAACQRLAALAGTPLLGIQLAATGPSGSGGWAFAGATPLPDLRLGGEPFLDHLAAALANGGRR